MKLNIDALFTPELKNLCPHKSFNNFSDVEQTFQDWTENPSSKIASGYRHERDKINRREIKELGQKLNENFSTLVVLGIGGSALGAQSLLHAFEGKKNPNKKIIFIDNLDPERFQRILESIEAQHTAVLCISKSGGTLESMAPLAYFLDLYKKESLKISSHFFCITVPSSGALREWVDTHKIEALCVPSSIGGRFSVFTAVGLLPLAFAGLDIELFLEGQNEYIDSTFISLKKDLFKLAHRLVEIDSSGVHGHCLFSYSSEFKLMGDWYTQLWGESLGKRKGQQISVGSFPISAVGSTDQHSLLQYLAEGPTLLTTCFLKVQHWKAQIKTPDFPEEFKKKLGFAEQKDWGEILNAQAKATQMALTENQKPSYSLEIHSQSEENYAKLYTFWMDLVSILGIFYQINPYDQPGVERGKIILPEILAT